MLDHFRYGQLPKPIHRLMVAIGLFAGVSWLYFSIIEKQLIERLISGQAELLDALIGFPLVLALAVVVYAIIVWAIKLLIILIAPHWIELPAEDELDSAHHSDSDKDIR